MSGYGAVFGGVQAMTTTEKSPMFVPFTGWLNLSEGAVRDPVDAEETLSLMLAILDVNTLNLFYRFGRKNTSDLFEPIFMKALFLF